jgi:hypothetical protein
MFEELKQISTEMKAIVNRSEQEGRKMSREEQEALDRLTTDRDVLLSDIVFHGYNTTNKRRV